MKKLLLTLLLLISAFSIQAQTPQAIWCSSNNTLYFINSNTMYVNTYDGIKITNLWKGTSITQSGLTTNPEWISQIKGYVEYVVFDSSFASVLPTSLYRWFYSCTKLKSISGLEYLNTSNVTSMSGMFYGCSGLTSLDVSHFDTSNVRNMGSMFYDCSGLTSLDVSKFDTSNVTDMSYMFRGFSGLMKMSLDLSHFDTSNVRNMGGMFYKCSRFLGLDLSGFNTSNVSNMKEMFGGCSDLTRLDLSHFNTSNVKNMGGMFSDCSGLTSLDLSHFDTSNVTDMRGMFCGCSNLITLNIANFSTEKSPYLAYDDDGDVNGIFENCSSLTTIYNNNTWTTDKYSKSMFWGCTSLVGGEGMKYSLNKTDVTYANPGVNGYFTKVPTRIDVLDADEAGAELNEGMAYDMSGRIVGDTSKQRIKEMRLHPGVYIVNGKKVYVK